MLFTQFVQSKALESRLPFNIDFEITPDTSNAPKTLVAGYEIPTFNELLSREQWFFEILGSSNGNRRIDIQIELNLLAKDLKDRCKLPTLAIALQSVASPSAELSESEEYQDFLLNNASRLQKIADLAGLLENDLAINWLKVTFFMASRVDSTWTMSKSAALRPSQVSQILEFINLELNGGIAPEPVAALPPSDDPLESEDVGNGSGI